LVYDQMGVSMIRPLIRLTALSAALAASGSLAFAGPNPAAGAGNETAIITNWGGDSVSIVNVKRGQELSRIPVGAKPYDVKIHPKGNPAFVTCSGGDYIALVDLVANLEMTDRRIRVGESPRDIAVTADGRRAVVACSGADHIAVVDLEAGKRLYTVDVGPIPYGVALTSDDRTAVITLWGSGKAVLVSLGDTEGKKFKELDIGPLPYTVVTSGDDRYAMATCFGDRGVYAIDLKNQRVAGKIEVGRSPWELALSPDGTKAVVANFYSGEASIIDVGVAPLADGGLPMRESKRIKTGGSALAATGAVARDSPKNVAFSGDSKTVLLTDLSKNTVLVLDLETAEISSSIPVGHAPYGIAFLPDLVRR